MTFQQLTPAEKRQAVEGGEQLTKPHGRKLTTKKQAERYGVCTRTIKRWREDLRLNFPQPMRVNGRDYTDEAEQDAWDAARKAASS
jgi:hypothetical protein